MTIPGKRFKAHTGSDYTMHTQFQKTPNGISFRELPSEYQQDEKKSYCEGDFGRIDALPNGKFRVYDSWKDLWHPFDRWEKAMAFFKMLCRINASKF